MLGAHSDSMAKMASGAARDTWRAWAEFFPLPRKEPHAILQETVVNRLGAVPRSLKGKQAFASYGRQAPADVYVLMVDSLVGWHCQFRAMPPLFELDANVLVTAIDFSWAFGLSENWRRSGLYGDAVFVQPSDF